jgi:transcription antitermination factor NusG
MWVVAIASPGCQTKALAHVRRAGWEFFCPRINWRGQIEWLFSRYFFVNTDRWYELGTTIGVQGVIRFGETIAMLSDDVVQTIRQHCDVDGFYNQPPSQSRFRCGQRVRIHNGPYDNQIGIYQGMRPNERADALVLFMGAWVHADLNEGDLVAA